MLAETILLGKLIFGATVCLVAVTALQFLTKLLELLMPLIKALAPVVEWATQTLLAFIHQASPIITHAVALAYTAFKDRVLGIIGHYHTASQQTVTVQQEVFTLDDDGTLRKMTTQGHTEAAQLPDYIVEALKQRRSHTVHHHEELLNEVHTHMGAN